MGTRARGRHYALGTRYTLRGKVLGAGTSTLHGKITSTIADGKQCTRQENGYSTFAYYEYARKIMVCDNEYDS